MIVGVLVELSNKNIDRIFDYKNKNRSSCNGSFS